MILLAWILLILVLGILGLMIYSLFHGADWILFATGGINDDHLDENAQDDEDALNRYYNRKAGYADIISLDDDAYYDEDEVVPPDGLDFDEMDEQPVEEHTYEAGHGMFAAQEDVARRSMHEDGVMNQDEFDAAVQEALYEFDGMPSEKARILREIDLQWPGSKVILQRIPLDSGILFHWAGLSRNEHRVLFVASDEGAFRVLMQCIQRICEDNVIPRNDPWILMADEDRLLEKAREEALGYFTAQNMACIVMENGFGIDALFEDDREYALVGIGAKLSLTIGLQKNQASEEWLRGFSSEVLFPATMSSVAEESVGRILPSLPLGMRLQFSLKHRQVVESISQLSPQVRYWFQPEISVEEQNGYYALHVNAMDKRMLDESFDIICQSLDPGIGFSKIRENRETHVCDCESDFFKRIQEAIDGSYKVEDAVPVLAKGMDAWGDWDVYTFAPVVLSEAESSMDAMIRFYYSLIV